MLKSENVVVIHGWMCNEFELKGNELLVYALIYGFSQDGESSFFGGRKYIAETFNISLPTVDKALHGLLDKGYIQKQASEDYKTTDSYWVDINMVEKKLYGGSKETLLNNISNNKKTINKTISNDIVEQHTIFSDDVIEKPKKKNQYQKCMDMIDEYTTDSTLRKKLAECYKLFTENSRDIGRPFYANNFKGKLNVLSGLASDVATQIKIVDNTLQNGWNGFYELKQEQKRKSSSRYTVDQPTDIGYTADKADKEHIDYGEKF
jgi:protein-arginine kinase activator protein McsA